MLIKCSLYSAFAQENFKDTLRLDDDSFSEIIKYSARDSLYTDLKNEKIHLFGEAKVDDGQVQMTAGYILIDLKKNEVLASYRLDEDSNKVELPSFSDGSEPITASTIRYNFDTEKGYIEELTIKQDESFIYMGIAKRHPNEEIHFKNGRFTTCDLEEPHYHFQLSKAILIPEERIVTGPMNLYVAGIPTPLGLPFSVIPQQKERTHGLLFPELVPLSSYGFGFQNLGYYIPINDHLQTSAYINLYSRGSWGIRNDLDYAKRYGYRGNLDIGFQQFRLGFPSDARNNKVSVFWKHTKEPKSNPYWNFGANVNFISDNQSKNNLDPLNPDYFNNSFNSDISIGRIFPGKPITTGLKLSVRQNSITNNMSLVSPEFNVNVNRVFPFKKLIKGFEPWKQTFSRIGVTYRLDGQNRSTFNSDLLQNGDFATISNQFQNGINQQLTVQTTGSLFKGAIKYTPSLAYGNKINFQQVDKSYDTLNNTTLTDTIQKSGMMNELNFSMQLTSILYNYYRFAGKNKVIMRHLITPSVGFNYVPQLNELITEDVGVDQASITYSPFERSLYAGSSVPRNVSRITFGINNTFELKNPSKKDTLDQVKKVRIIDALSFTGSYDLTKDSMNLSDISINLRINPISWFNFVGTSTFSPYSWDSETGTTLSPYALSQGRLGRFLRTDLTSTITLTSQKGKQEISNNQNIVQDNWNSDMNYYALHPEYLIDYDIPWKINLSHVFSIVQNTAKTDLTPDNLYLTQTLVFNGDVSFTKRWKASTITNLDLQEFKVTNTRIALSRNLHCWALSFNWTPIGGNKSFLFSIRNTSSIFQDAKIEFRKPPLFL